MAPKSETSMRFLAGLFYGIGVGGVVAWFLNSSYVFNGSDSKLAFLVAIVFVTTGTGFNMRASNQSAEHQTTNLRN